MTRDHLNTLSDAAGVLRPRDPVLADAVDAARIAMEELEIKRNTEIADMLRTPRRREAPMGADSKIAWTHHTFNAWWGCEKVSEGCKHCYAETWAKRTGFAIWGGADSSRRLFGDKHWNEPLRWNAAAEKAGVRARVFCSSMADVFEDRPDLLDPRRRLFRTVMDTPSLDWLLLTKRPENAARLWHDAWSWASGQGVYDLAPTTPWLPNIWLGTTVENQARANERIPHLLAVPAAVRFLSMEPLLEAVDLGAHLARFRSRVSGLRYASPGAAGDHDVLPGLNWVIVGGESGPRARPFNLAWARSLRDQCKAAGVPFFMKQLGAHAHDTTREIDSRFETVDMAGADPAEWPSDLVVREWPEVSRG